jgi:23S rRNA-/tRNA-specific pseudouridylate synthase
VHRLGRGTSGVLLCARSKAAREGLSRAFAEDAKGEDLERAKPIQKTYRALV